MFYSLLSYLTHFFYNNQFENEHIKQNRPFSKETNANYNDELSHSSDLKNQKNEMKGMKDPRSKDANGKNPSFPNHLSWENYTPLEPSAFHKLFKATFEFSINDYFIPSKARKTPKINIEIFFTKFLPQMLFNDSFMDYVLEECLLVPHLKLVLEYNSGRFGDEQPSDAPRQGALHEDENIKNTVNLSFQGKTKNEDIDRSIRTGQSVHYGQNGINEPVGSIYSERKDTIGEGPSIDNELGNDVGFDSKFQGKTIDQIDSIGSKFAKGGETHVQEIRDDGKLKDSTSSASNTNNRAESWNETKVEFDEMQITIALKIILNGFMKKSIFMCNEIISHFSLNTFFNFLQMKELYPKRQALLLKYYDAKDAKSVFEYHIEIVWLSYAILGKLFSQLIRSTTLHNHIKIKKEPIRNEHLKVLRCHEAMYKSIFFLQSSTITDPNSRTGIKQNILETESGHYYLERFIEMSNLIFRTNEIHLIELGLATIGQLVSNSNDPTLDFLVSSRNRIDLRYIISKFILCSDLSLLTSLGRLIMTLICRNVHFIDELLKIELGERGSFINELLFICFQPVEKQDTEKISLRIQYLNILFVIIIYSKAFTIFLLHQTNNFNFLDQLTILLNRTEDFDLPFLSLQLLYGILHHEEAHGVVLPLSSLSKRPKNQIILSLKRLSFSPFSLVRYYCLLIWKLFSRSQNQAILHYLVQQEQMLSVLTLLLREEKEISLTRLNIATLYEIVIRKNNSEERNLLLSHYNILFELTEIFKEALRYVRKYVELHSKQINFPSLFLQYIGLLRDIYFLFVAFCNYDEHSNLQDQENESKGQKSGAAQNFDTNPLNSSHPSEKYSIINQLIDRYNMIEFFKGYLFVLSRVIENGNHDYENLHKAVKNSMRHLFKIGGSS